jgi:hypothetical protein
LWIDALIHKARQLLFEQGNLGRTTGKVFYQTPRSIIEMNRGQGQDAQVLLKQILGGSAGGIFGPNNRQLGELRVFLDGHKLGRQGFAGTTIRGKEFDDNQLIRMSL